VRIGIDAMGGDLAPGEVVKGAVVARELLAKDDKIVLVGLQPVIEDYLSKSAGSTNHVEIRHADQMLGMDEPPVESLRAKPRCSIGVMAEMHRDGEIDACISAGNTGACVAAAQMRLRRLRGVHRPGIAVITPTPPADPWPSATSAPTSTAVRHTFTNTGSWPRSTSGQSAASRIPAWAC